MKVIVASHAKNHIFHLVEGLAKHGNLANAYSIYPKIKLHEYQIPTKFLKINYLLTAMAYFSPKIKFISLSEYYSTLFDDWVARKVKRNNAQADIFHGLNGFSLQALKAAKTNNIRTVVDRACPHIHFQANIISEELERLTGKKSGFIFNSIHEKMLEEYELADKIVVPSLYTYNSFVKQGVAESKLKLVPLMQEKPVSISANKSDHKEFVVLAIGFNFYRKGFYYLLKAWEKLKLPNAKLIVRCDVPKQFLSLIKESNVQVINSHLSTEDLIKLYQGSDLFCLPSIDEGFGMVGLEAMAAGLPVIVTENVGMKDLIAEGREGLIVPIRDDEALANAIVNLYENKTLRDRMSQAGIECAKKYNAALYVNNMLKAYKELLSEEV